MLSVLPRPGGD